MIRCYAGYPVKLPDGEIAGALCILDTQPRLFSDEKLHLLRLLAELVEDEFKIISMATTDSLTGLLNRRSFLLMSQEIMRKSRIKSSIYSVALISMDNLKKINNEYGHAEGDIALKHMANIIDHSVPQNSFTFRRGGNEFGIIFPRMSLSQASKVINSIILNLRDFNKSSPKGYKIIFSCGMSQFDDKKHETAEAMLKEADRKMYQIKDFHLLLKKKTWPFSTLSK